MGETASGDLLPLGVLTDTFRSIMEGDSLPLGLPAVDDAPSAAIVRSGPWLMSSQSTPRSKRRSDVRQLVGSSADL